MGVAMAELYEENYNLRKDNDQLKIKLSDLGNRLAEGMRDKTTNRVNLFLGGFFVGLALMASLILTHNS